MFYTIDLLLIDQIYFYNRLVLQLKMILLRYFYKLYSRNNSSSCLQGFGTRNSKKEYINN